MNPPLSALTVSFSFSLMHCIALTRAIQIGSRVEWWDTRGQLKQGTVKQVKNLTDVRSLRCKTDLILTGPHFDFL
jgi:hypothetical protein